MISTQLSPSINFVGPFIKDGKVHPPIIFTQWSYLQSCKYFTLIAPYLQFTSTFPFVLVPFVPGFMLLPITTRCFGAWWAWCIGRHIRWWHQGRVQWQCWVWWGFPRTWLWMLPGFTRPLWAHPTALWLMFLVFWSSFIIRVIQVWVVVRGLVIIFTLLELYTMQYTCSSLPKQYHSGDMWSFVPWYSFTLTCHADWCDKFVKAHWLFWLFPFVLLLFITLPSRLLSRTPIVRGFATATIGREEIHNFPAWSFVWAIVSLTS